MSYIFREHIKQSLAVIAFLITLTACTSESYDAGDGPNSYLTADLVLLHTSQDKSVRSALLDDGTTLQFSNPVVQDWLTRPDSVYRALLYYDYHEGAQQVRPRSLSQVLVLRPMQTTRRDTLKRDPMVFESAWMSKNGKFNLGIIGRNKNVAACSFEGRANKTSFVASYGNIL